MSSSPELQKPFVRYLGSSRHTIRLEWSGKEEPHLAYTVQFEDRAYEWITKYWGTKTKTEIQGLGPEELYTIRVGVSQNLGNDVWGEEVWSDTIVSATQWNCLDVYNKYGETPLILAIREKKEDAVDALVDNGADVSQPGKSLRKTPLMVACFGGYKAAADALVNRGVDWNMVDSNKCQALHYAVDGCKLEMVRYGIERGANVNAQDKFGWTPLMRGVLIGCGLPIISLLIDSGADVNLRDQIKMRALDLARLLGSKDYVELLEKYSEVEEDVAKEEKTDHSEDDISYLEDERDIEIRQEEEDEREAEALMKKIDHILGLPVEDDKLQENDEEETETEHVNILSMEM